MKKKKQQTVKSVGKKPVKGFYGNTTENFGFPDSSGYPNDIWGNKKPSKNKQR